jgi:hypothetical protein
MQRKPRVSEAQVFGGKVKLKGIQDAMQVYKIVAPDFDGDDGTRPAVSAPGLRASAETAVSQRAP